MERREEETKGESMSHIPGVKPIFKEEWKKASRNEKTAVVSGLYGFGVFAAIGFVIYFIGTIDTMETMEQTIKLILLCLFLFTGWFFMHTRFKEGATWEKYDRVKKGLRYDWDAEDLDELEERIRMLEKKL